MANARPGSLQGRRILVVEDEPLIAMVLTDHLEDEGAQVEAEAYDLDAALAAVQVTRADLAILDVNLAGQMSFPVAAALRARGIPFVFVTGYAHGALPPEFAGVTILEKPYSRRAIAAAVTANLRDRPLMHRDGDHDLERFT